MPYRARKSSLIATAVSGALASLWGQDSAHAAGYTVGNTFTLPTNAAPFLGSDGGPGVGYNVSYNASSVTTFIANPSMPNGVSLGIGGYLSGYGTNASGPTTTPADPTGANNGTAFRDFTGFVYDSYGFRLVGVYTYNSTVNHPSIVNVRGVNPAGQAIGYSYNASLYNSSATILGQIGWINNVDGSKAKIGLANASTQYTKSVDGIGDSGTYINTTVNAISATGYVIGTNTRFYGDAAASPTTNLGSAAWEFVPNAANSTAGTTYEIGLTGVGNSYNVSAAASGGGDPLPLSYHNDSVTAVAPTGAVAGIALGYTTASPGSSLGSDAWLYSGGANGSTSAIGGFYFNASSGSNFTTTTTTVSSVNAGTTYTLALRSPVITPASGTFMNGSSPTTFTYGYISTTAAIGSPTDPANAVASRNNTVRAINTTGAVGITSTYYFNNTTTSGTDAFVYKPGAAKPYTQVGLTTGTFPANTAPAGSVNPFQVSFVNPAGQRNSTVNFLNDAGQSAGTSTAYVANSAGGYATTTGTAAWYASATGTTTQIGLFNNSVGIHVNASGAFFESVTQMNQTGMVAGYASRYNASGGSVGQDAWVYDPATSTTYPVDPTDAAITTASTTSTIFYLTDNGYALGTYSTGTTKAFIWSQAGGFQDLDSSLPANLSGTAYQNIVATYFSNVNGSALVVGTNSVQTTTSPLAFATFVTGAGSGSWNKSTGGTWNSSSNWTPGIPNGAGLTATLGPALAASDAVTLDGVETVGHVVFNNSAASYTIAAGLGGMLAINNASGTGSPDITVLAGSHTISAGVNLSAGVTVSTAAATSLTFAGPVVGVGSITKTGAGTVEVAATGSLPTAAALNVAGGTVTFDAAATGSVVVRSLSSISVAGSSTLTLSPSANHSSRTLLIGSTVAVAGRLDLGNGDADFTATPLSVVNSLVASGFNAAAASPWTGAGIVSTSAATDPSHLTALGVIQNNQSGSAIFTASNTFASVVPGAGDVFVKYTYFGDANLDGTVDASDYTLIDNGYNTNTAAGTIQLTGWFNGDFNYDGVVDGSDYTLIDNAYNFQGAALTPTALPASPAGSIDAASSDPGRFGPDAVQSTSAVPEPAAATFVFGLILLCRRRVTSRRLAV